MRHRPVATTPRTLIDEFGSGARKARSVDALTDRSSSQSHDQTAQTPAGRHGGRDFLSWGGPGTFPHRYAAGKRQFEAAFGVRVVETRHALREPEWIARNPRARADDLMEAFADTSIDGIIATIGGDDAIRVVPFVDLSVIRAHPKVFLGYSDTTIAHLLCLKAGLVSFYGPSFMAGFAENGGLFPYMEDSVRRTLFSTAPVGVIEPNRDGWTVERLEWGDPANQSRRRTLQPSTDAAPLIASGPASGGANGSDSVSVASSSGIAGTHADTGVTAPTGRPASEPAGEPHGVRGALSSGIAGTHADARTTAAASGSVTGSASGPAGGAPGERPTLVGERDAAASSASRGTWRFLQGSGVAEGRLIGGCLDVLWWVRGSSLWPDAALFDDAILFLETSEEAPPPLAVARELRTLAAMGLLSRLSGLIVGRPGGGVPIAAFDDYDRAILQIVAVEQGLTELPIITRMDFGHTDPMCVLPYGVTARIDCARRQFAIIEPAVTEREPR